MRVSYCFSEGILELSMHVQTPEVAEICWIVDACCCRNYKSLLLFSEGILELPMHVQTPEVAEILQSS